MSVLNRSQSMPRRRLVKVCGRFDDVLRNMRRPTCRPGLSTSNKCAKRNQFCEKHESTTPLYKHPLGQDSGGFRWNSSRSMSSVGGR